MNRRELLKNLIGGVAMAAFPVATLNDFIEERTDTISNGEWMVDASGNISYVGNGDSTTTIMELHRWLHDLWDEECKLI